MKGIGKRDKPFQVRLSEEEKADVASKAQRCCLDMSALFRLLIRGYEPKEKPDEEFYAHMRELSGIANNINQLERLNKFQLAIEKKYLEPEKSRLWQ